MRQLGDASPKKGRGVMSLSGNNIFSPLPRSRAIATVVAQAGDWISAATPVLLDSSALLSPVSSALAVSQGQGWPWCTRQGGPGTGWAIAEARASNGGRQAQASWGGPVSHDGYGRVDQESRRERRGEERKGSRRAQESVAVAVAVARNQTIDDGRLYD